MMLPLKTVSEGNCFEAWQKKHARHKSQKSAIARYMEDIKTSINLPCHVILKRYGPRLLDAHDNLPYAMKWLFDSVCNELVPGLKPGRADSDSRISVSYDQEKSKEYGVKIEFKF